MSKDIKEVRERTMKLSWEECSKQRTASAKVLRWDMMVCFRNTPMETNE